MALASAKILAFESSCARIVIRPEPSTGRRKAPDPALSVTDKVKTPSKYPSPGSRTSILVILPEPLTSAMRTIAPLPLEPANTSLLALISEE